MSDLVNTPDLDLESTENTESAPLEAPKGAKRGFSLSLTNQGAPHGKIHLTHADTIVLHVPEGGLGAVAAWFNDNPLATGHVVYKNRRPYNGTYVADFVQLVLN